MELTKETLVDMYVRKGMAASEIESSLGLKRNQVFRKMKKFNIEPRVTTHDAAVDYVMSELSDRGFVATNVRREDSSCEFDILLDGKIRVQVLSASKIDLHGAFRFALSESNRTGKYPQKQNKLLLRNGRIRKIYRKTCEYLIVVGMDAGQKYIWVIPSNEVSDTLQTLRTPTSEVSKYNKYYEDWNRLRVH
ncbi:hypothetical protein FT641_18015 [Bacillus paranthracis]|uniref:hypothetical protein n=1 Tax=Bacillus paranthracis TaxID=2026186 RepID=UPI00187AC8F6|nr:hypothetical protein [Bacillus paranthracis]MBE7114542.1 hypothetical protein [Bacillus paranthracis]MBE7154584.1 hypothetical protein [Bacillus paranthracis]